MAIFNRELDGLVGGFDPNHRNPTWLFRWLQIPSTASRTSYQWLEGAEMFLMRVIRKKTKNIKPKIPNKAYECLNTSHSSYWSRDSVTKGYSKTRRRNKGTAYKILGDGRKPTWCYAVATGTYQLHGNKGEGFKTNRNGKPASFSFFQFLPGSPTFLHSECTLPSIFLSIFVL